MVSAEFGWFGGLAHLGERLICIQEVAGSIPVSSTKFSISGRVAELVDALVLGTSGATRESSSLSLPTNTIGPFVYRLGHVVFILERGVRLP
jgi:hypothetical protein